MGSHHGPITLMRDLPLILTLMSFGITLKGQYSRSFLLPPEENGERHRAKVTRQVIGIIDQDSQRIENINFILDIGNGKVEEIIS